MKKYSIFSLVRNALNHHEKWQEAWRSPEPKPEYDVIIFSQRGVLNLGRFLKDMRDIERRVNANRLNGIHGVALSAEQVKELAPIINTSPNARYPILGPPFQPHGGTGGFKATPGSDWVFAHTIAQNRPHPINERFSLERFTTGHLIDGHGAAAVAH